MDEPGAELVGDRETRGQVPTELGSGGIAVGVLATRASGSGKGPFELRLGYHKQIADGKIHPNNVAPAGPGCVTTDDARPGSR